MKLSIPRYHKLVPRHNSRSRRPEMKYESVIELDYIFTRLISKKYISRKNLHHLIGGGTSYAIEFSAIPHVRGPPPTHAVAEETTNPLSPARRFAPLSRAPHKLHNIGPLTSRTPARAR